LQADKEWEHKILSDRVAEQQKKKKRSRRVIQKGGVLHVGEAWAQIAERDRKEAKEIQQKADFAAKKEASKAKKDLHQARIEARKAEKERIKMVRGLEAAREHVLIELYEPIPDLEKDA